MSPSLHIRQKRGGKGVIHTHNRTTKAPVTLIPNTEGLDSLVSTIVSKNWKKKNWNWTAAKIGKNHFNGVKLFWRHIIYRQFVDIFQNLTAVDNDQFKKKPHYVITFTFCHLNFHKKNSKTFWRGKLTSIGLIWHPSKLIEFYKELEIHTHNSTTKAPVPLIPNTQGLDSLKGRKNHAFIILFKMISFPEFDQKNRQNSF